MQADQGSFSEFKVKEIDHLDFQINLGNIKKNKTLSKFRQDFQNCVYKYTNTKDPITVLNAPTGTGKTEAFLKLIDKYKPKRVFYFSPLVALTDNIAERMKKYSTNPECILEYNHVFTGTLDKLNKKLNETSTEQKWNFDHESFNEIFVITTTQRLLMTLYSDKSRDKLKLASFRDSLLIIDEIQTLPKFLLHNIVGIFRKMSEFLNVKILLVSATVPHELKCIPTIEMSEETVEKYLDEKNREIIVKEKLEVENIKKNSLVMFNTRKDAAAGFEMLRKKKNVRYVSSGITKKQRSEILKEIAESNSSIIVSTQVLEAGVDVSFSSIWRQIAPLDNIVQALGRLDRESKDKTSKAYIFDINTTHHKPYSSLEFQETKKIIRNTHNTVQLYHALDDYYKSITQKNMTRKEEAKKLSNYINELNFKEIWNTVSEHIGEQYYDTVYVPDKDNYDQVCNAFITNKKAARKKYAEYSALLPKKAYKYEQHFVPELYSKDIFMLKKEKLDDFYDKDLGLDIWINK